MMEFCCSKDITSQQEKKQKVAGSLEVNYKGQSLLNIPEEQNVHSILRNAWTGHGSKQQVYCTDNPERWTTAPSSSHAMQTALTSPSKTLSLTTWSSVELEVLVVYLCEN